MENEFGNDFIGILVSDVNAAISRREENDSQAARRDLIRTIFAAIDGFAWTFREETALAARETYGLEENEEIVLSETAYSVTEKGKIAKRRNYISTPASIRLSARILTRISKTEEIDFNTAAWSEFHDAIEIRNRITHPKSEDDLLITDEAADKALEAFLWLFELIVDLQSTSVKARISYLGELEEVFAKLKAGDPDSAVLYKAIQNGDI